jgi:hypothetical protein
MTIWAFLKKWLRRGGIGLLVVCSVRAAWHIGVADDPQAIIDGHAEGELVERRDYLSSRLGETGAAPADSQFAGEWAIVTCSMTAASAAGIGFDYPATVGDDLRLAARAVEVAREPKAREFDTARWGSDALDVLGSTQGHIGFLGHLGIALEAYRLLGGSDTDVLDLEQRVADALARRVQSAPFHFVENAVVFAVLALTDVGRSPKFHDVLATALTYAHAHLVDTETGLLDFAVGKDGEGVGGPRASGAAWSYYYLAIADPIFANEQAHALQRFRKKIAPGAEALCERIECNGSGDVDSGPLLFGISPAATGFAMASARRLRDAQWLGSLLSTAEWAGCIIPGTKRHYVLAPLVGDAIVLAMMTSRSWDARYLTR